MLHTFIQTDIHTDSHTDPPTKRILKLKQENRFPNIVLISAYYFVEYSFITLLDTMLVGNEKKRVENFIDFFVLWALFSQGKIKY